MACNEINRTRLLANELSRLLRVPVGDYLSLSQPVSKRRTQSQGASYADFERAYAGSLVVDDAINDHRSVLLIDDVSTRGGTFRIVSDAIREKNGDIEIVAVAGTQMLVKEAVATLDRIEAAPE